MLTVCNYRILQVVLRSHWHKSIKPIRWMAVLIQAMLVQEVHVCPPLLESVEQEVVVLSVPV